MAGGLVTEQELRALGQSPGDRDPLLLATRELRWKGLRLLPKPDQSQKVIRCLGDPAAVPPGGPASSTLPEARMAKAMFSRALRLGRRFAP